MKFYDPICFIQSFVSRIERARRRKKREKEWSSKTESEKEICRTNHKIMVELTNKTLGKCYSQTPVRYRTLSGNERHPNEAPESGQIIPVPEPKEKTEK